MFAIDYEIVSKYDASKKGYDRVIIENKTKGPADRSYVTGFSGLPNSGVDRGGKFNVKDSNETFSHEFGHLLGVGGKYKGDNSGEPENKPQVE